MKKHRINRLTLAVLGTLFFSQAVFAATSDADTKSLFREEISSSPGRTISRADESLISSSAGKVLNHIALAREMLRKSEHTRASQELKQAETLLGIIHETLPTTMVKDRIWTADNKIQYENVSEVSPASVPIYASLDERINLESVKTHSVAKRSAQTQANDAGKTGENRGVGVDEVTDAALHFESANLPLNATRHFITSAQRAIAEKRYEVADQALRAAQDSVDFVSVEAPAPMLAARINLQWAHEHFNAGKHEEARQDVERAIGQLSQEERQAMPEDKAELQKLLTDANSLKSRITQGGPQLGAELKTLWHRTEALTERARDYVEFGWAKLRSHNLVRDDLIEARRYVSYADINANVANSPTEARQDLERAKEWLDRAAIAAKGKADAEVYTHDASAVVDTILEGKAKPDVAEMANLKRQLSQAISQL